MKHVIAPMLVLLCSTLLFTQNIVYVKLDATGNNDGSSWSNAYNNLQFALDITGSNAEIWVAAGTYRPEGFLPNNPFSVVSGVRLYGGFNGTENSLEQRDPQTNPTILSGDLNGNDIKGDFNQLREDNSIHVVSVFQGNSNERVVIDGFRIEGGNTLTEATDPDLTRRGGGILAEWPLTVRNCHFSDNFAVSGAGIAAVEPNGAGLLVDNCVFERNLATSQSAGILIRSCDNSTVKNCIFRNNTTNRGCVYPVTCTGIVVDSCLFENNITGTEQWGGGMFSWQASFTLSNSIFRGNTGHNAGAIYNDGREGGNSFVIEKCLFENNTALAFGGGGIYNWQANYTIRDCIFRNNVAPNGTGIYNDGREGGNSGVMEGCIFENNDATDFGGTGVYNFNNDFDIIDCLFQGNTSAYASAAVYNSRARGSIRRSDFINNSATFGGAMAIYNPDSEVTVDSCRFTANLASTSGGAIINGFQANTYIKNSVFQDNAANFGGAIYNQNDTTYLSVENSQFSGNGASNFGGAISIAAGIKADISTTRFIGNSADFGGAMYIGEDSLDLTDVLLDRCEFRENISLVQAGALNIVDADVRMTNCLLANNFNIGPGVGGAISNNATENKSSEITAINCTFAYNEATFGAGVAQWEAVNGNAVMNIQNCIFAHDLDNYYIEQGDPDLISFGGNLSSDNTMNAHLTETMDLNSTDPVFVDPVNFDYHLGNGSPCINAGIASGAPSVDLNGELRDAVPDKGCYEFPTVGIGSYPVQVLAMQLQPNPATDQILITIATPWSGNEIIRITDNKGVLVKTLHGESGSQMPKNIQVGELPSGIYRVTVQTDSLLYKGAFIKK